MVRAESLYRQWRAAVQQLECDVLLKLSESVVQEDTAPPVIHVVGNVSYEVTYGETDDTIFLNACASDSDHQLELFDVCN